VENPHIGGEMTRKDVLLAILAAARGQSYTPAQLQKGAFLITRNLPGLVADGLAFNFMPYDYGPFDRAVYDEASALQRDGLADIHPSGSGRWNVYSASSEGVSRGDELLAQMSEAHRKYVAETSRWVRSRSFTSLVKSIYEAYPEMRANSVFRG
jgi:hypothetical protein